MKIKNWKIFLNKLGLYDGNLNSETQDLNFKCALQLLEKSITKYVPAAQNLIFSQGRLNSKASLKDVKNALNLINKFEVYLKLPDKIGQAPSFDSLPNPTDPDYLGSYINEMFVSQEDSKSDNFSPKDNQNIGNWISGVPEENSSDFGKNMSSNNEEVNNRMEKLINLMKNIKK
jgi:hypothetical protein